MSCLQLWSWQLTTDFDDEEQEQKQERMESKYRSSLQLPEEGVLFYLTKLILLHVAKVEKPDAPQPELVGEADD